MYRKFNVEQAKEIRLWIEHIIVPTAVIVIALSPKIRTKIKDMMSGGKKDEVFVDD